jgi:hypothetical protein
MHGNNALRIVVDLMLFHFPCGKLFLDLLSYRGAGGREGGGVPFNILVYLPPASPPTVYFEVVCYQNCPGPHAAMPDIRGSPTLKFDPEGAY